MSDLTLPLDATVEIRLAGVELAHHIRHRPGQGEWEAQVHYPRTVTTHVDPWHDDPEEWTSLPVPARFADLDADGPGAVVAGLVDDLRERLAPPRRRPMRRRERCAVEGGSQNAVLVHGENDGRDVDGWLVGFASLHARQVHPLQPSARPGHS